MKREYTTRTIILPTGYTQLQYIKSTGTQYINTGVTCGGNKFRNYQEFEKYDTSTGGVLFGSSSNNDNQWTCNPYFAPNSQMLNLFPIYLGGIGGMMTMVWVHNVKSFIDVTVDDINKSFECNLAFGNNVNLNANSDRGPSTIYPNVLYIFASRRGTITQNLSKHILYRHIMWINDVKVRDFIPALRDSDSKPGLYDIVNDVFYTNAGTGEFLYA